MDLAALNRQRRMVVLRGKRVAVDRTESSPAVEGRNNVSFVAHERKVRRRQDNEGFSEQSTDKFDDLDQNGVHGIGVLCTDFCNLGAQIVLK